jgi:maltodextrin utilization protein YvdJ
LLTQERNAVDGKASDEGKKLMIVYNLNMLTSLSNEDGTLMEAIANSEELEIFDTDAVKDLIDYKWQAYANQIHMFGFLFHVGYVFEIFVYLNITYLWVWDPILNARGDQIVDVHPHVVYLVMNMILLIYPLVYDGN